MLDTAKYRDDDSAGSLTRNEVYLAIGTGYLHQRCLASNLIMDVEKDDDRSRTRRSRGVVKGAIASTCESRGGGKSVQGAAGLGLSRPVSGMRGEAGARFSPESKSERNNIGCLVRDQPMPSRSVQTASSLPEGSAKWKRRPPGKTKVGRVMVPPAWRTAVSVASRLAL